MLRAILIREVLQVKEKGTSNVEEKAREVPIWDIYVNKTIIRSDRGIRKENDMSTSPFVIFIRILLPVVI